MNRYLVDKQGDVLSAFDERLVEKFGYPLPDFDLPASSYLIDGVQRDPSPGDRFGDGSSIWEVMPIGRRKCFEALDGDARVIRVHTRKVIRG